MSRPLGRHEHGQNFLVDPAVPAALAAVAESWEPRPLLELGPGDGALTAALLRRLPGRPLTAVELDPHLVARLRRRFGDAVSVVHGDLLHTRLDRPVDVVSNVPYALTTPLLRRLLAAPHWRHALLLVQWEVARKRAAVGPTSALTARWWPWFEFRLHGRVPARAFRPVPAVDGGVLEVARRATPLLDAPRGGYQRLVDAVFTGRGRGVVDVVARRHGRVVARDWARSCGIGPRALPRDLDARAWVLLHDRVTGRT
ncbi:23S ribosomal RNA methyltransferase Erm [Pseudonocardia sp. ICBG1293]|uniref:23S ribosomal RNA methyltransferase Erm n=1 Tax=Pseudonocardia sp. ICBG1293 TaxID=2844382 RepID=UPI001CCF981A|nr:23S ribosomal RNA methyltransferase Erm [Pseudonocardia sp. ICBG1293]